MACSVCETACRRGLLCPSCFSLSCTGRQSDKRSLQEQRDAAERQLQGPLDAQAEFQRQQMELLHLEEALQAARRRTADAGHQLAAMSERARAARLDIARRRQRLEEGQRDLAAWQARVAELAAEEGPRTAACARVRDALAREQRTQVVRRAMEVLPLTLVPAPAGAGAPPRDVAAICGLPLPDGRGGVAELAELSRTLGTLGGALGYVAALLDLLSRFLQLPLLHRAAFQGSTSRLWQPDGFFDTRATPPADATRLAWPSERGDGAAGGFTALGGGGGAAAAAQQQRAEAQLRSAVHALRRSAGVLVYARLGPDAASRVPQDDAPFTWLAKLCWLLAAEPRSARSGGGAGAGAGRDLAASAVLGRGTPDAQPGAASVLLADGGGGEDDDWEQLPLGALMPPRPCEPEDVEHWERANFASGGGDGSGGSGGSGAAAALAGVRPVAAALLAWTSSLRGGRGTSSAG